jgi:hypothetical protein
MALIITKTMRRRAAPWLLIALKIDGGFLKILTVTALIRGGLIIPLNTEPLEDAQLIEYRDHANSHRL